MSLGAAILGWVLLLILLGLLALLAALLPRILSRWEGRPEVEKLSLQELGPPSALPVREVQKPVPVSEVAPAEDPLLAAAIALALDLYLKERQAASEVAGASFRGLEAASPWRVSGRWLAMQGRLNVKKR